MATICVIGASRGIGKATVNAALKAGHSVRALARTMDTDDERPGLTVIRGDATDPADVRRALQGANAVILALGVKLNAKAILREVTLFSTATEALIPGMKTAGVNRLVAITGFAAGDSRGKLSMLESLPFKTFLGRAYTDKDRQEVMIRASGLDWTILRPGILTNGKGKGRYQVLVEPNTWHTGVIARADVADCAVKAVDDPALIGKTPALVY